MNLIEVLVVCIGLSLDVYAVVVCQGALLLRIEKLQLLKMMLLFCAWQVAAVVVGHWMTLIPYWGYTSKAMSSMFVLISVIIFMSLGIYMLYKAWKKEEIFEHLSTINYKHLCVGAGFASVDSFFAGMGFGFLNTGMKVIIPSMLIITAIIVILGLYTAIQIGYEQKTKAYTLGGILLIISALNIIIKYLA